MPLYRSNRENICDGSFTFFDFHETGRLYQLTVSQGIKAGFPRMVHFVSLTDILSQALYHSSIELFKYAPPMPICEFKLSDELLAK